MSFSMAATDGDEEEVHPGQPQKELALVLRHHDGGCLCQVGCVTGSLSLPTSQLARVCRGHVGQNLEP